MASAAEYKIALAFENGKDAIVVSRKLIEMNHPQHPTSTHVYNTKSMSFIDSILKEKLTKITDIKYHYLKDR